MKFSILALTTLVAAASAAPATCVASAAASTATSFSMTDYTAATAPVSGTGYDIDAAFQAEYGYNNTMVCLHTLVHKGRTHGSFVLW